MSWLEQVAPTLATALLGPLGGLAVSTLSKVLGVDEKEVTVAITKDARFYVNSEAVNQTQLAEKLTSLLAQAKDKKVVVKADGQTKTKYIMSVMKAAQEAGYEKLTVAGEPLSRKQQTDLETTPADKNLSSNTQPPEDRHTVELPQ